MANAIYWDTSALLKLYAPESGSSDYLRLLIRQPEDLAISFLHRVELYFALRGKESRGEIAAGSAARLFELFGFDYPHSACALGGENSTRKGVIKWR